MYSPLSYEALYYKLPDHFPPFSKWDSWYKDLSINRSKSHIWLSSRKNILNRIKVIERKGRKKKAAKKRKEKSRKEKEKRGKTRCESEIYR